jgi:importin subunit beta-1
MKATANVIAEIAAIEISRKEWMDIINLLAQNSMHSDLNVKRASITTLGYICEEIKSVSCNVPNEYCEQILGSLLLGLREQGDIAETSLTAIRNSIVFLGSLLENMDCCNQTFSILLPYLNSDYCEKVYQILFEFGRSCYHLLGNYIGDIYHKTVEHIQERNNNTLLALEFWDTVGTEYLRRYDETHELIYNKGMNVRNYIEELQ